MKAWILQDVGKIEYTKTKMPAIKNNEVLVKVKAAGICGSDIPRIYRDGAHQMPLILGHEFSGEVVQVGENADSSLLFQKVGVYPLLPCRSCIACQKETYEMCRQYSYLGSRRDGGFAEYAAVPAENVIKLPEQVTFEQAAMLEPMAVAMHAMRRVRIKPEETVVVYGLGTIGLLLLMLLLEEGVSNVLAIGNKAAQKEAAKQLGLSESNFCNGKETDVSAWMKQQGNGYGADVVFECVGKNQTLSQAILLAAAGGRVCVVGNPEQDMHLEQQTYWKILRNQLSIFGTWNSSFFKNAADLEEYSSDWEYVLELLKKGKIAPQKLITHRFAMEELEQGFHIMRDKTEDSIKIMMLNLNE